MATYEIRGAGEAEEGRIRAEVYGRYVNNGRSIVAGCVGENGVTELALYGVPEIGDGQVVTLKWFAEDGGELVDGAQIMTYDPDAEEGTVVFGNAMTRYGHTDCYIQADAEGKVWRSYSFKILFAALPQQGGEATEADMSTLDQMLARLSLALGHVARMREEVDRLADKIGEPAAGTEC